MPAFLLERWEASDPPEEEPARDVYPVPCAQGLSAVSHEDWDDAHWFKSICIGNALCWELGEVDTAHM